MKKTAKGAPTKFRLEYPEKLIEHMTEGLSYSSFAGFIRVDRTTLYLWEKEFPEWLEAKEIGESLSLLWWETAGRDGVWNTTKLDDKGKPIEKRSLNAAVWIVNMNNRFGWRNRVEQDVKTTIDVESSKSRETVEKYLEAIDASINERKS